MEELKEILFAGAYSLVMRNGEIRTFDGRGVSDLFRLLKEDPAFMKGAEAADKVIGKGAAALMILGGVREVYGEVVSEPALRLFEDEGVKVTYGTLVPHIINRKGDGICPVETLCADCRTAEECLPLIADFIMKLQLKK